MTAMIMEITAITRMTKITDFLLLTDCFFRNVSFRCLIPKIKVFATPVFTRHVTLIKLSICWPRYKINITRKKQ